MAYEKIMLTRALGSLEDWRVRQGHLCFKGAGFFWRRERLCREAVQGNQSLGRMP